jgi:hypothetical protein
MVGLITLYGIIIIANSGGFMTKFSLLITLLVLGSLLIGTCTNTQLASSSYTEKNIEEDEYSFYFPFVQKRNPYLPIFGVETRNYHPAISQANLHWLRINGIRWSLVQPTGPENFDWSGNALIDAEVIAASQNGLEPILVIRSTPEWAQKYQGQFCGPIKEEYLPAFANFAKEVVKLYSQPPFNVRYFQIWNEPDAPVTLPGTMPFGCWAVAEQTGDFFGGEYFAEMLKAAYPAMKSANPNIKVVLGGLLLDCDPTGSGLGFCNPDHPVYPKDPLEWNFFEGILSNGGGSAFDIVAFHGYGFYSSQEKPVISERNHPNWSANGGVVDGKIKYLRETMARYGVNKPLLQTEAALVYHDPPNALINPKYQAAKADYIVWTMARNWAEGLIGTTWYSLYGWRGSELLDNSNNPLPAYESLKNMAFLLHHAEFISRQIYPEYEKFIYNKHGQRIWLLIPTHGDYDHSISIPVPSHLIKVEDLFGEEISYLDNIVFHRPIYLFISQ